MPQFVAQEEPGLRTVGPICIQEIGIDDDEIPAGVSRGIGVEQPTRLNHEKIGNLGHFQSGAHFAKRGVQFRKLVGVDFDPLGPQSRDEKTIGKPEEYRKNQRVKDRYDHHRQK